MFSVSWCSVEIRPMIITRSGPSGFFGWRGVFVDNMLCSFCEIECNLKRLWPLPQRLVDLLALCFRPRMGVVASHAEAIACGRLVAQCDLAHQGIDVGVLQERGKSVPPRFRTRGFGVADCFCDANERGADRISFYRSGVSPNCA